MKTFKSVTDKFEEDSRKERTMVENKIEMNGAETLYGFAGWLTSRDEVVTASSRHDATVWADLVDEFIKHNELQGVRSGVWPDNMKNHPEAR